MLTGANLTSLGPPGKKLDQAAAVAISLAGVDIPYGAVERAKAALPSTTTPQTKQTAKRTAGDHFSPKSAMRIDETKKPKGTTAEEEQVVLVEEPELIVVADAPDRGNNENL